MEKAPILDNEADRLAALQEYQILDSEAEIDFDEITHLAALVCKVPISLVSFIDRDRQWFKSNFGLNIQETPRDISFCGHAIHSPELFIVEDARKDPRFSDNPLTTEEPHVVFYAGAPLMSTTGFGIGTLCLIDTKPRVLDETQKEFLTVLAKQVVNILEIRKQNFGLKKKLDQIREAQENLALRENQLLELTKTTFVNQLASGVAHEINNPLAVIKAKMSLLENKIKKNSVTQDELLDGIKKVNTHSERILTIIKGLQALASHSSHNAPTTVVNVSEAIEQALLTIKGHLSTDGINFVWNPDDFKNLKAQVGYSRLVQALTHILINAKEATLQSDLRKIELRVINHEDQIEIQVINSGPILSDDEAQLAFIPFYTTKRSHRNAGLGLSITKSLLSVDQGDIKPKVIENQQAFSIYTKKVH